MNKGDTVTLIALRRILDTRRRREAAVWAARWPVIARQLAEMRAQS
jgi:hypothetical protein